MARMIGRTCPDGPGGRGCSCCGQAPGKDRKTARRKVKRSERNAWKRAMRTAWHSEDLRPLEYTMSPLQRLINEGIPDGTYGEARTAPWTPAEQLAHRLVLEEAIDGWTWTGDPESHSRRDAA